MNSHCHFMTWCGTTVRLWYVNPAFYGCSQGFDTGKQQDQIEIIKLLHFFTDEKYANLLCGQWDIAAETQFEIEEDGEAKERTVNIKKGLQQLDVRPGPFGARTAVWADQDDDDRDNQDQVTVIKVSWVASHLTRHELMILRKMWERVKLPNAPRPIGTALLPPGFQHTTSETTPSPLRGWPARFLTVLVTEQCVGIALPLDIKAHDSVFVYQQLAEQLLLLAEQGFHYRDLNEGNIRLLRGTHNVLLIVDFGNVRFNLSRRGDQKQSDAAATIDRAKDDTRSANPLFLPACCVIAEKAVQTWENAVDQVALESRAVCDDALGTDTKERLQLVLAIIQEKLPDLHQSQRDANVYSHRYIDDLESAAYLQLWQVCAIYLLAACPKADLPSVPSVLPPYLSAFVADGSQTRFLQGRVGCGEEAAGREVDHGQGRLLDCWHWMEPSG